MIITIIRHEQIGQRCITQSQIMHNGKVWNNVQVYNLPESRKESRVNYFRDDNFENVEYANARFDVELIDAARLVAANA